MGVIAGVDVDRLQTWMDEQRLGEGPIVDVEPISGGTQNILLRFVRAGRQYVLRHPPPHKRKNSDETMRREARLLAALAGTDVPHPALIADCPDLDVLGSAFYLMEPVDGFNPSVSVPEPHLSSPDMQHEMGLAMVDAIAALGRVDHTAVGLADFGKPDGWLERQVERWRAHLESYPPAEGYPGPDIPGVDVVGGWLAVNMPLTWRAGLIHGDFHFANVLIDRTSPKVAAMVDWELATVGDPLLDLGHLLCTWPSAHSPMTVAGVDHAALPTRDELIERYAAGSDRDVRNATWYQVLACYRLGIILEGTNARAYAGQAPREIGDLLHAHTVSLFEQALALIH